MTEHLKIRKVGSSLGLVLPKDVLAMLDVSEGDQVHVIRTSDGIQLTRFDPKFDKALSASRKFMRRYPNAMKKLAE